MSVIELADHRPPVNYTICITHHWDDRIGVYVEGIADDDRSRASAADALRRAADLIENGKPEPINVGG